jgi:hypothetical protein
MKHVAPWTGDRPCLKAARYLHRINKQTHWPYSPVGRCSTDISQKRLFCLADCIGSQLGRVTIFVSVLVQPGSTQPREYNWGATW